MNIFAILPRKEELVELIEQFSPSKVYLMRNTINYSEIVAKHPDVEFIILNYFKYFSTAFNNKDIEQLPAIDALTLKEYKDLELECLFNDERIGRNNGLAWNNSVIHFDKDLIADSYNKYFYQVERKTTLERFRDFRYQLAYWLAFFEKHEIDLIFNMVAAHMPFNRILHAVADKKGVKFFYTQNTSIVDRCFVISNNLDKFYADLKMKYNSFVENNSSIFFSFTKNQSFSEEYNRITKNKGEEFVPKAEAQLIQKRREQNSIFNIYKNKLLRRRNIKNLFSLVSFNKIIFTLLSKKKQKRRNKILKTLFTKNITTNTLTYFYFPMHFQPEETSCPRGGRYADQLLIIKLMSECLPSTYKLIIKDHPQQKELYRPIWFYKEILMSKNTILVDTSIESRKLIEDCEAIVTISGTAAWEGFGKGKPAMLFGTHPSQVYKHAYKVTNKEDCLKAINSIVNNEILDFNDDLQVFFEFLYKFSSHINFQKEFPHGTISAKDSAKNYISKIKDIYLTDRY